MNTAGHVEPGASVRTVRELQPTFVDTSTSRVGRFRWRAFRMPTRPCALRKHRRPSDIPEIVPANRDEPIRWSLTATRSVAVRSGYVGNRPRRTSRWRLRRCRGRGRQRGRGRGWQRGRGCGCCGRHRGDGCRRCGRDGRCGRRHGGGRRCGTRRRLARCQPAAWSPSRVDVVRLASGEYTLVPLTRW